MKALRRRLTQEHYMEEGVIIVDIRTFLRLYVQKKILGTRSECTKSGEIDLYCMTGVFYIWLVKSPTYAMMRVNVSEKDYKNKIDSGSNFFTHRPRTGSSVAPPLRDPSLFSCQYASIGCRRTGTGISSTRNRSTSQLCHTVG